MESFHIECEDINKCIQIYNDLFVYRGLDEEDLKKYFSYRIHKADTKLIFSFFVDGQTEIVWEICIVVEKQLSCKKIIITLLGFVVFWTVVTDAWGYSDWIFRNDPHNIGRYIYGYFSRCIWVLPAILLIIKYSNHLMIQKCELFKHLKFDKSLIIVIAISLGYVVVGMLINHKRPWFNSGNILGLVVVKYIIVGFVEETVFRGWGYNSLANIVSHKKAALISTVFFILLHWSAYFIKLYRFGTFDFMGLIGQSSSAMIWGFVFCWLLKKGQNLWNPILAHGVYDLTYVLLVGGI